MDADLRDRLQTRLTELCGPDVPGAALAFTDGTDVVELVHGVTSIRTGQPVTPATLFQVGSISKVYTATLVMALVDAGTVDLDATVQSYLPWFAVADAEASAHITVRQLLCHTAGFEGDDFTDTGRGDDALRRYVEGLAKAAQIHPLGAMFSYCNSGFSTLGQLVEAVTDGSWDDAVQTTLAGPLGITLGTLAEQVILHPHAIGHMELPVSAEQGAETALQVAPMWAPPRSVGPAGTICSSAKDVLTFGRMHVQRGLTADGTRVLSEESVAAMQQTQVLMADSWTLGKAWGLGWILPTEGVIGHDGATFGQHAYYRLHPGTGTGLVLLTNGPGGYTTFRALYDEFFAPAAGVGPVVKAEPAAAPPAVDAARYVGDYERLMVRMEVREVEGGLTVQMVPLDEIMALGGRQDPIALVGFEGDTLVTKEPLPGMGLHMTATFVVPEGGATAGWIHFGGRATARKA